MGGSQLGRVLGVVPGRPGASAGGGGPQRGLGEAALPRSHRRPGGPPRGGGVGVVPRGWSAPTGVKWVDAGGRRRCPAPQVQREQGPPPPPRRARSQDEIRARGPPLGPAGRRATARRDAGGGPTLPSNGDPREPQLWPQPFLRAQGPPQPALKDAEAPSPVAALNVHLPTVGMKVRHPCLSITHPDSPPRRSGTLAAWALCRRDSKTGPPSLPVPGAMTRPLSFWGENDAKPAC